VDGRADGRVTRNRARRREAEEHSATRQAAANRGATNRTNRAPTADGRAAQATDPRDFVTALTKTCAEMPYAESGWMSRLAQAWSTHPTLDQRVEAIQRAFRQEFGPYVPSERVRRQRVADATTRTYTLSLFYCENLTLGGFSDWRLPTVFELQTIVDESVDAPSIDTVAFDGGGVNQNGVYWTTTKTPQMPSQMFVVDFGINFAGGSLWYAGTAGDLNRVRCVR